MIQKVGKILLAVGIFLLIASIVIGVNFSTIVTYILLWGSIAVNAVAVTMLRSGKKR